jgi:hypothetical protein
MNNFKKSDYPKYLIAIKNVTNIFFSKNLGFAFPWAFYSHFQLLWICPPQICFST